MIQHRRLTSLDGNDATTYMERTLRQEEVPCRQFGQLRKKRKNRKKKHTRKEKIIRFLQSVGFGKTSQIIPIVGNPRRAKQKSSELVIGLYFSTLKLVLLAVDVSCCRPIADARAGSLRETASIPTSTFSPSQVMFFSIFSPFLFISPEVINRVRARVTSRCGLQVRVLYYRFDTVCQ